MFRRGGVALAAALAAMSFCVLSAGSDAPTASAAKKAAKKFGVNIESMDFWKEVDRTEPVVIGGLVKLTARKVDLKAQQVTVSIELNGRDAGGLLLEFKPNFKSTLLDENKLIAAVKNCLPELSSVISADSAKFKATKFRLLENGAENEIDVSLKALGEGFFAIWLVRIAGKDVEFEPNTQGIKDIALARFKEKLGTKITVDEAELPC
jgi:hypothetical protein